MGKQKFYDEIEAPAVAAMGIRFATKVGNTVLVRGVALRNQVFGSIEDDEL